METKGFFQFEIIINVLVSSFNGCSFEYGYYTYYKAQNTPTRLPARRPARRLEQCCLNCGPAARRWPTIQTLAVRDRF